MTSVQDQSVTLIDAMDSTSVTRIQLNLPLGEVAIGPDGLTAWVFSAQDGKSDFYLVDLVKQEVRDSVRLRDWPGTVAFSADGSRAYVPLYGGSAVAFLDATDLDELGTVGLGRQTPGVQIRRQPRSVAVASTPSGEVLLVAGWGSGVVWALDAGSGELLAEVEVGGGPAFVLPEPGGKRVYAVVDSLNQLRS